MLANIHTRRRRRRRWRQRLSGQPDARQRRVYVWQIEEVRSQGNVGVWARCAAAAAGGAGAIDDETHVELSRDDAMMHFPPSTSAISVIEPAESDLSCDFLLPLA